MAKEEMAAAENRVDDAVAAGGAYEVIRKRLTEQGQKLKAFTDSLNHARTEEFGSTEMQVLARTRVRTENNSIARDMVQVGPYLLFGYNVFIGLKKEVRVDDVFELYRLEQKGDEIALAPQLKEGTFLADRGFVSDFEELYRYYKHTRLVELAVKNGKLLAGFQIGEKLEDIRVFRWALSADQKTLTYIDNRGERDIQLPPAYDFEWIRTTREHSVHGKHPHVNIEDTVFVETVGGDLTIKVENNTEDGLGIYREPVEDKTQSLDDAEIYYARVGKLILLKILPYREQAWRFFIFNTLTETVVRQDALAGSCVQLPEDHGVIFPGGYYLESGETKLFDQVDEGFRFKRRVKSPNGEDVLYCFYEPESGRLVLLSYNLIEKSLRNPLVCNGYALADNGRLVIFNAEAEPTRVHPMQVWETPFISEEYASQAPPSQSFLGNIGNAAVVRGVSDLYSLCKMIAQQSVSRTSYEELIGASGRVFDDHYWLDDAQVEGVAATVREIQSTAELVIDEFVKVQSIQAASSKALQEAQTETRELLESIRADEWHTTDEFVAALLKVRQQRGHLISLKELRYINLDALSSLEQQLVDKEQLLQEQTLGFLAGDSALAPYEAKIDEYEAAAAALETGAQAQVLLADIDESSAQLDLLSEMMASLSGGDVNATTRIVENISLVYASLNQCKARARNKAKSLGLSEAVAQFSAQFKLLSQGVANALSMATTPDKCDEQLSRLLVQLEELEGQFGEHDQFLTDILSKREEIYDAFESHKQQLLDEQQKQSQAVADAAYRVIESLGKRSQKFTKADELNTFFASDPLVLKVREFAQRLRDLNNPVKADDVESKFKALVDQAKRGLRDKSDIYEADGSIIKLGPRHRFSVNKRNLDLTIIPREDSLAIHLTGTDYFDVIDDEQLNALKPFWNLSLGSETADVYRAEYLAYCVYQAIQAGEYDDATLMQVRTDESALLKLVRDYATPRYKEGYEKGIHDHDACKILHALLAVLDTADTLRYSPKARVLAQYFVASLAPKSEQLGHWQVRARAGLSMRERLQSRAATQLLVEDLQRAMAQFAQDTGILPEHVTEAAEYLVAECEAQVLQFATSRYGSELLALFTAAMGDQAMAELRAAAKPLCLKDQVAMVSSWVSAVIGKEGKQHLLHYSVECVALFLLQQKLAHRELSVELNINVAGLLGDHRRISEGAMWLMPDEFFSRVRNHHEVVKPGYENYLKIRADIAEREKRSLRLDSFKARPLTSFVRNRLINESYLPLIGDNLAKQMGTVGENKRTDLMGLLMMISPPGYGKTTLMEYVASRLGLIFMKINCPSLGHDVLSLDPEQAPNATSRKELEKLNLALEMSNNVMLYLDDIQHTHPEFLQKFISLCDGTRRIEGVWKGDTKTYDMRGKKFCVVMAGNPYTESGEVFKIPDMLANRADIYNLGDILGGMDEQFGLSYIENAMTSNPVLAPLATRDLKDLYKFVRMAQGEEVATTDLSHEYSGSEVAEITGVLRNMLRVRDVVLRVNQEYIASAAKDDKYRTEPPFKLQGSYRNMNKMTEKLSAVMNEQEINQMIADHYVGEAQLLTTGAEANLLKLSEIRGLLTAEQQARWDAIKKDFMRNKSLGGDDADTGMKLVAQLTDITEVLAQLNASVAEVKTRAPEKDNGRDPSAQLLAKGMVRIAHSIKSIAPQVQVVNEPVPGLEQILTTLANTLEHSIFPLVRNMDKKLEIDLRTHDRMQDVSNQLRALADQLPTKQ
ncbi:DNA repair ATPase [Simiduia sp. 21SJ11W-1]|uniref:DNA repair ATPase n=1 Tax=Simiduia sp. 21SJ11W-1 TaxID=2909669 RepID=UPI00209F0C3C|nr:DNA repair ATPase [Simiduia sp. 21SJ11W-1]UTA48055.1 DNA repair ATPase [Simiduia sp. 21SJ11W-1]